MRNSALVRIAALAMAVGSLVACKPEAAPESTSGSAPAVTASAPPSPAAPLAGERVEIPGGEFFAGSLPGDPGREPELEPRRYRVALGPFHIDRLPYPNDPEKPPLTGLSRDEAARRCSDSGGRLCTELEWERACKGPESTMFATGASWNSACEASPEACGSAFDVLGLGVLPEWTGSNVVKDEGRSIRAAVRGASVEGEPDRRCAHRQAVDRTEESHGIAFRCCKGPPNAAKVREPEEGQTFQKHPMKADELAGLLAKDPHTAAVAKDIVFFREPDAANTVVARGPGDRKGFLFTVTPLLWNPVAGATFLVVAARSGERTSFVVVYHALPDDQYRLASSFIMKDEVGPVALAYNGYIRPRLHFSTCWGCPGETGKILYRDPDAAVILQP